jgi:hypothetical protein
LQVRERQSVIDDHPGDDIRSLSGWRSSPHDRDEAAGTPVADDVAPAPGPLSCKSRDREQFQRGQASAHP